MRNRNYFIAAILLAASFFLSSCDEKDFDERYEEMEAIIPQRNVLLEEFTGQMCPNCPLAHQAVEGFKKQYGEHLIAVSIHAGYFALEIPNSPQLALQRPEGNIYANESGVTDYPAGVFNRRGEPLGVNAWIDPLRAELVRTTPLQISAEAQYQEDGKIHIIVDMASSANLSGKLQVWVTESNIVASQKNELEQIVADYTHNHVFQACVNGTWGEDVVLSSIEPLQKQYEIVKKDYWKVSDLAIVAFVYNKDGVVQVTECPIN